MAGSPWIRQATDPGPNRPGSGRPVNLALTGAVATQASSHAGAGLARRGQALRAWRARVSPAALGSCRHGRWEGYLSGAARSLPVPGAGRPCRPSPSANRRAPAAASRASASVPRRHSFAIAASSGRPPCS